MPNKADSPEIKSRADRNNKLISIRIPVETIQSLRERANTQQGRGSYQKLIKTYIAEGLAAQPVRTVETVKKFTPANGSESIDGYDVFEELPAVMREDIESLALNLKPYWSYFSGRSFVITRAFGFLGRYLVHLLHHLNQKCLDD